MNDIKTLLLCFYDHSGCYDELYVTPEDLGWALSCLFDDDDTDEYQRLFAILENNEWFEIKAEPHKRSML